jgi:hypothetical protein
MSKFSFFLGTTPLIKLKLELHVRGGLLIANHQIIMIDQLEILNLSQVQFITLVFGVAQLCCALYQPRQCGRIWCGKTNFLS